MFRFCCIPKYSICEGGAGRAGLCYGLHSNRYIFFPLLGFFTLPGDQLWAELWGGEKVTQTTGMAF